MKRTIFLAIALITAACQSNSDSGAATSTSPQRETAAAGNRATETAVAENRAAGDTAAENRAADNTGKNERDRSGTTLTSGDQGGSEADRAVTQRVRQGLGDRDELSVNAKNVKIVTQDGVVTLRGPVKTDKEKADIGAIAQGVQGVTRVDNQLEVATH